jgi:hypothetical protein
MGLVVYELAGALSRAFSSSALAAFAISDDVFARTVRPVPPVFNGRGGGARSGSELSHLNCDVSDGHLAVWCVDTRCTYMGICGRRSDEKEAVCRTISRSRESSLSEEGIVYDRMFRPK